MRIILFSDSLGRPRPDIDPKEKTEYEDTYPYLVKKHFAKDEVEIIYIESLDSEDAIHWNERMVCFRRPDVVVYHLGINDCAPRVFSKNSHTWLLKPWLRKVTRDIPMRAIHKYRRHLIQTICRGKVYTSLAQFKNNWQTMLAQLRTYTPESRALAIGISPKPESYDYRSPGINSNISRYNEVMRELFGKGYIDASSPDIHLISDGIHFTKETHARVADLVCRAIEVS